MHRSLRPILPAALALLLALPAAGTSQSVLDRTPNLSGGWTGSPGQVHFNFIHRFWRQPAGIERKIINVPTFLLGTAVVDGLFVGLQYSSNSVLLPSRWNEVEGLVRWAPLRGEDAPVQLALTGAYNHLAESADGEVSVALPLGPLKLMAAGRYFSNGYNSDSARTALAGGVTWRLSENVALAGDVVSLMDLRPGEDVVWGGALQLRIPTTPHTLSLQATNARTTSLQGASTGPKEDRADPTTPKDRTRWGFEFTIPITLARFFGGGGGDAGGGAAVAATEVTMNNQLRYEPASIRIRTGQTVTWRNTSALPHTVTGDPSKAQRPGSAALPAGAQPFDSGNLAPGATFTHTFTVPGEYRYFCIPHEGAGMVGTVIVEG